jgi:hypothetical protein
MRWFVSVNFLVILAGFVTTHLLIKSIYYGNSLPFLNQIIAARDVYPLSHYLKFGYITVLKIVLAINVILIRPKISVVILLMLLIITELYLSLCFVFPHLSVIIPTDWIKGHIYHSRAFPVDASGRDLFIYDEEVTYTFAPNTRFTLVAPEYRVSFNTNSMGLRDDEESLASPDIIVLGDSEAAAYSVEKNQSYAQLIENESGLKVLCTGIKSFGTVRQMRLLNQLDTSNLKYLIIDYHSNDYIENKYLFDHGRLDITPRKEYERLSHKHSLIGQRYYPGKYVVHAAAGFVRGIKESMRNPSKEVEAQCFLNALMNGGDVGLEGVKIIVITYGDILAEEIQKERYPDFVKNISIVDCSTLPKTPHTKYYYTFDGHRMPPTHKLLAEELLKLMFSS